MYKPEGAVVGNEVAQLRIPDDQQLKSDKQESKPLEYQQPHKPMNRSVEVVLHKRDVNAIPIDQQQEQSSDSFSFGGRSDES